MQLIDKIIKNIVLLISAIFLFLIIMPFIMSGFKISVLFTSFQNLLDIISDLQISKNSFEIGALVLMVGTPAIIINHLSKIFPQKFNFILLPAISFLLIIFMGIIHSIIFEDTSDMKGLAIAIYVATSIIFLIIFSLIISLIRLRNKNV